MTKYIILFFIIAVLVGSCSPATVIPTRSPTATLPPTITPSPTPSAIPTITPYPSIQTQGPYLLFTPDNKNLTLMDANGSGRRQIEIPNNGYIGWDLNSSVSPDGKWLVFFTGSTDEPYDLTLNLFNLKNETTFEVTALLADGYPENLMLTTLNKELCPDDHLDCQEGFIQSDFEDAITRTIAWSPDSQTLAFAAQIDGPSSDIYLYNIEDKSIRRLVNDLENVWYLVWSPTGEKILYENFQSGNYTSAELHIADPNIVSVQSPKLIKSGAFWAIGGWVDNNLLLIFDSGDGGAPHNLKYLNIQNQQTKSIWKYELEIFAADTEVHGLIFALQPEIVEYYKLQFTPGTYFISVNGGLTKITDEIYDPLREPGFSNSFFAGKDHNLYNIRIDEPSVQLIKENVDFEHSPRLAPNKKWLIVEGYDGFQLFSENLELIKSWDIRNTKMIWRPDSLGLFLFIKTAMYYLPIPDGEPVLIEDCAPNYCSIDHYVWLQ